MTPVPPPLPLLPSHTSVTDSRGTLLWQSKYFFQGVARGHGALSLVLYFLTDLFSSNYVSDLLATKQMQPGPGMLKSVNQENDRGKEKKFSKYT